jgi:hypothetical protein
MFCALERRGLPNAPAEPLPYAARTVRRGNFAGSENRVFERSQICVVRVREWLLREDPIISLKGSAKPTFDRRNYLVR